MKCVCVETGAWALILILICLTENWFTIPNTFYWKFSVIKLLYVKYSIHLKVLSFIDICINGEVRNSV